MLRGCRLLPLGLLVLALLPAWGMPYTIALTPPPSPFGSAACGVPNADYRTGTQDVGGHFRLSTREAFAIPDSADFNLPWKIGIALSTFYPSSAKTRARFGSWWSGIGLTVFLPEQANAPRDSYQVDFGLSGQKRNGDFIYLVPIGIIYQHNLGQCPDGHWFVGGSADLFLSNLHVSEEDIHAHIRTTLGGSVFAGVTIWRGWQFRARYFFMGDIASYNFSGTALSVVIPL